MFINDSIVANLLRKDLKVKWGGIPMTFSAARPVRLTKIDRDQTIESPWPTGDFD